MQIIEGLTVFDVVLHAVSSHLQGSVVVLWERNLESPYDLCFVLSSKTLSGKCCGFIIECLITILVMRLKNPSESCKIEQPIYLKERGFTLSHFF